MCWRPWDIRASLLCSIPTSGWTGLFKLISPDVGSFSVLGKTNCHCCVHQGADIFAHKGPQTRGLSPEEWRGQGLVLGFESAWHICCLPPRPRPSKLAQLRRLPVSAHPCQHSVFSSVFFLANLIGGFNLHFSYCISLNLRYH